MMVLFECDRKKCGDRCSYPSCKHTTDVRYAKNFTTLPFYGEEEVYEEKIVKDSVVVYVVVVDEINEHLNMRMRMPVGVYKNKITAVHAVRQLPKEANPHIYEYKLEG